jgi:ATP synthase F1 complex assembly factor 2
MNARSETIDKLTRYVDTDSVNYLQPYPESFDKLQSEYWSTLVKWLKTEHDLDIKTTNGILPVSQSSKTRLFFKKLLQESDDISLAAFEKTIMMTKSVIIPFALFSKKIQVDVAVTTARLEVLHQIDRWGQVEDSHDTEHLDFKRVLGAASIVWLKC